MTRGSVVWRVAGAVVTVGGAALTGIDAGAAVTLIGFVTAIAGLTLVVEGRRVPVALRIERSRHRRLPEAIHARRRAGPRRP